MDVNRALIQKLPAISPVKMAHANILDIFRISQPKIHCKPAAVCTRPMGDAATGLAAMKQQVFVAPTIGAGRTLGRVQHHPLSRG